MAVRLKRFVFRWTGAFQTVFGRASGVDERSETGLCQNLDQLHQCSEIGAIDERVVDLEGISAVGYAVEQSGGADLANHVACCRKIDEIDLDYMSALNTVEP